MSATLTGRNLIAGRWQSANGTRFESRSPARESEILGVFPSSSVEEAQAAVAAAQTPSQLGGAAAASIAPNCSTTWPRSSSARPTISRS